MTSKNYYNCFDGRYFNEGEDFLLPPRQQQQSHPSSSVGNAAGTYHDANALLVNSLMPPPAGAITEQCVVQVRAPPPVPDFQTPKDEELMNRRRSDGRQEMTKQAAARNRTSLSVIKKKILMVSRINAATYGITITIVCFTE
jgi:hypothetical protein